MFLEVASFSGVFLKLPGVQVGVPDLGLDLLGDPELPVGVLDLGLDFLVCSSCRGS